MRLGCHHQTPHTAPAIRGRDDVRTNKRRIHVEDILLAALGDGCGNRAVQSAGTKPIDYDCRREIRSNARLVAMPKSAQNNRLVSVTTMINRWDSAAGIAL